MGNIMGMMKKVLRYSVGMAVAGIAGYEIAKMQSKRPSYRETTTTRSESMGYTPREETSTSEMYREESSDPRDYRSIYNL